MFHLSAPSISFWNGQPGDLPRWRKTYQSKPGRFLSRTRDPNLSLSWQTVFFLTIVQLLFFREVFDPCIVLAVLQNYTKPMFHIPNTELVFDVFSLFRARSATCWMIQGDSSSVLSRQLNSPWGKCCFYWSEMAFDSENVIEKLNFSMTQFFYVAKLAAPS